MEHLNMCHEVILNMCKKKYKDFLEKKSQANESYLDSMDSIASFFQNKDLPKYYTATNTFKSGELDILKGEIVEVSHIRDGDETIHVKNIYNDDTEGLILITDFIRYFIPFRHTEDTIDFTKDNWFGGFTLPVMNIDIHGQIKRYDNDFNVGDRLFIIGNLSQTGTVIHLSCLIYCHATGMYYSFGLGYDENKKAMIFSPDYVLHIKLALAVKKPELKTFKVIGSVNIDNDILKDLRKELTYLQKNFSSTYQLNEIGWEIYYAFATPKTRYSLYSGRGLFKKPSKVNCASFIQTLFKGLLDCSQPYVPGFDRLISNPQHCKQKTKKYPIKSCQ